MLGSVHLWGNGEVVQTPKSVYNRLFVCALRGNLLFSEMPENGDFPLSFEFFLLSFDYISWVMRGNIWMLMVFSLTTLYILKNWVIFLPWELDFEMKCEIFKKYTFKFWPKNAGKLRFLLEFWVIFLSFRFLEFLCPWVFLRGAQKKAWATDYIYSQAENLCLRSL